MVVDRHQLKRKQFNLADLQRLVKNPLERGDAFLHVEIVARKLPRFRAW